MLQVFIRNEAVLMNGEIDSLKAKQIELSLNYQKKKKKINKKIKKELALICFSDTVLI